MGWYTEVGADAINGSHRAPTVLSAVVAPTWTDYGQSVPLAATIDLLDRALLALTDPSLEITREELASAAAATSIVK